MNRATLVRINGTREDLGHQPTLTEAHILIEGYIELVAARDSQGNAVTLVVDEDGKPSNKPVNKYITETYGKSIYGSYIVGDVIVLEGWNTVAEGEGGN